MKINKLSNEDAIYETSFHGDVIKATTNKIKKIIGEPDYNEQDIIEKVQKEWDRELEDGTPFTIYDWKEYRPYADGKTIGWHIGARSKEESAKVARVLKELGFNVENVFKGIFS